jgi:hypothetical protein
MQSFAECDDTCPPNCKNHTLGALGTIDDAAGAKIVSEEIKGRPDIGYDSFCAPGGFFLVRYWLRFVELPVVLTQKNEIAHSDVIKSWLTTGQNV